MTDEEIEAVAQELAKVGGVPWYPGRTRGPILRTVNERYRDRARVAIGALERLKAGRDGRAASPIPSGHPPHSGSPASGPAENLQVGALVMYRPPGDRRAATYRVERMENGRAYLAPHPQPSGVWVLLEDLSPLTEAEPNTDDKPQR